MKGDQVVSVAVVEGSPVEEIVPGENGHDPDLDAIDLDGDLIDVDGEIDAAGNQRYRHG